MSTETSSRTAGSPAGAAGTGTALAFEGVTKAFGRTRALDGVSFGVAAGHVHGLLGGNGSGKSTLIKVLAGVHAGDAGTIAIGAERLDAQQMTPDLAEAHGLRFVHQDPAVFPTLTVAENLALGGAGGFPSQLGGIRWRALRRRARALLERYEIDARPDELLGRLRPADQTMVAIARALAGEGERGASILVLDEPTASLPEHEVDVLLAALRRCAAVGLTILYVSHRLDEVLALVDDVTVLRDGAHVVTRSAAGLSQPALIDHIIGRSLASSRAADSSVPDHRVVLRTEDLAGGPLRGVDLAVRAGEVVGVAGLLGSGRTELLRMVFGAHPITGGILELDGRPAQPRSPAEAMALGVAYVPENREADAAFPDQSLTTNMTISRLADYRRGPRLQQRREREDTGTAIEEFSIRTDGPDSLFSALSGGNQQKVVLARWLARNPTLLLLDEPTQGVDVGARADVYAAVRRAVSAGMAVLLVTSDFEELAQVADRVLVLRGGRIRADVPRDRLTANLLTDLVHTEDP